MLASHLSYQEISKYKQAVALLPTGALEQHGPYLPLGTDAIIAEEVGKAVEANLPQSTILYPTVFYGCSKEHRNFPGTVFLEFDTYMRVIKEILSSIFSSGISKVLIIGGHGGNNQVLRVIQADWNYDHPKQKVYYKFAFTDNAEGVGKKLFGSMESHAGSVETSIVYSLSKKYRKTNKKRITDTEFVQKPNTSLSTHTTEELGKYGIVAKVPTLTINPQKGGEVFETMVKDLTIQVERLSNI